MHWLKQSPLLKTFVSAFIVLSLVFVSYAPAFQAPKQAEALFGVGDIVFDPSNLAQMLEDFVVQGYQLAKGAISAAMDTISAWGTELLALKENWLDGIAWYAINLILHQLAQSTIQWINSGFNGSPAFVTDLGGFMRGIGDQVAGEFINGTSLAFLCSPFKLNVQLALKLQYSRGRNFNSQCTLSSAVSNMEAFLAGDFLAGGWDGWFKMTSDPYNNPYGALLMAQEELSMRLSSARGQEMSSLNFSKGFLSVKECAKWSDTNSGDAYCEKYETVTPGSAIEHQLNSTLDIPNNRLMVADEINEIIAALLGQLVKKAFAGAGGLRGMTSSSYGAGSGSYFTDLENDTTSLGFNYHPTSTAQSVLNQYGNITEGYVPGEVTNILNGGGGTGGNTGGGGTSGGNVGSCTVTGTPEEGPQWHADYRFTESNLTNAQRNYNWLMDTYGSSWGFSYIYGSRALLLHNQFRFAFDPEAAMIVNIFGGQGQCSVFGCPLDMIRPFGINVRNQTLTTIDPKVSIGLPYPDNDDVGSSSSCAGAGNTGTNVLPTPTPSPSAPAFPWTIDGSAVGTLKDAFIATGATFDASGNLTKAGNCLRVRSISSGAIWIESFSAYGSSFGPCKNATTP